ncbi:MAG: hypothetical protein IT204_12100 [Fimbriimonadaceae bacterium]|nr:hypothetical protein [Fimbriimonadaceae bacterium]
MRLADVQADALAFMYAHEFVEQSIEEKDLHNPLLHDIEYPTKAPLSDRVIDRNEVAEKVIFVALADLVAQRRLKLTLEPPRAPLGQRWLLPLLRLAGAGRPLLLVQRDGSFPASPLNKALTDLFDSLWQPGSDFISEPRLPLRRLLKLLFQRREKERDPYHDVLQWVGDELVDEGFYNESTEVAVGALPFKEAHPDKEKMLSVAPRVEALKERLTTLQRRDPELYEALRSTVKETIKEISVLFARRYSL